MLLCFPEFLTFGDIGCTHAAFKYSTVKWYFRCDAECTQHTFPKSPQQCAFPDNTIFTTSLNTIEDLKCCFCTIVSVSNEPHGPLLQICTLFSCVSSSVQYGTV